MRIAVAGATGAVGREMCSILHERRFPATDLRILASRQSAGQRVPVGDQDLTVEALSPESFQDVDLALFALGSAATRDYVPCARQCGTTVIDNSSAYRMQPDVPLVIPEINRQDLAGHAGLIANPNCSTIIMAVAVWPLHQIRRITRMIVSTYQAASGAGAPAMQELLDQTRSVMADAPVTRQVLPHQCAFNVFSHDSAIDEQGYNQEEVKMVLETHKIFHDHTIGVTATCVRVPVLRAHSESINLTFESPLSPDEARDILADAPGIRVVDRPQDNYFPMPIDATGKDQVLVGRIRSDRSDPSGCSLNLFVCGDQLRKGAALNAIQIAECL